MIKLENVKKFLRISYDNDDIFIESLIDTSKQFIKEQTGVDYSENDKVYSMAILQSVAHFYDKREAVSDKTSINVPFTLDCLIKHIGMRGALKDE